MGRDQQIQQLINWSSIIGLMEGLLIVLVL